MKYTLVLLIFALPSVTNTMEFSYSDSNNHGKIVENLDSRFRVNSKNITKFRTLIKDSLKGNWSNFAMASFTQEDRLNFYERSLLFHECCDTLVYNMKALLASFYKEQGKKTNFAPTLRDLFKEWTEKSTVDINTQDVHHKDTPLHYIIRRAGTRKNPNFRQNLVVTALLAAKADPTIKNHDGQTPSDLCKLPSTIKTLEKWIAKHHQVASPQQQPVDTQNSIDLSEYLAYQEAITE